MVSPALLRQPAQRERWFADWEKYGLAVPTVWQGLIVAETNPEEAREHLERAIREGSTRIPEEELRRFAGAVPTNACRFRRARRRRTSRSVHG